MVLNEPPSVSVSRRGHRSPGSDPLRTVVWVSGEHDIATRGHLAVTIEQAARLDDAGIVVDLSGVTFMDASTIGALVAARNRLRSRSRTLSIRAPSPRARRLLDLCRLAHLIDGHPTPALAPVATALGSWVAVPASDRGSHSAQLPVAPEVPTRAPARATDRRHVEPALAVRQRPAPA